jgi:nucleoside-diphosphate-sugar epimerase
MTALVTGAAGFIGAQVVNELLARGTRVRALVRKPAQADALRERGVDVRLGDVRDMTCVADAVRDADVVYHCAALVGPGFSRTEIYAVNRDGVARTLEALRRVGRGRFVFLSTLNVLGTRNLKQAAEDTPQRRSSDPAADVKIEAERLVTEYGARHGVATVVVRPGVVYGPGDRHNLPKLIAAIERGKFAYIGSRDNLVPLAHVRDAAQGLILAGETPAAVARTYHITDGERVTIGELVDALADLVGAPRPTKVLPYLVPYAGCLFFEWLARLRLYHGPAPIGRNSLRFLGTSRDVDISRARKELGFEPRVVWRAGVQEVVRRLKETGCGHSSAVLAS